MYAHPSRSLRRLARSAVLVAFAALGTGCIEATFTQTVGDFTPHAVDRAPDVFLDRLPQDTYASVGIIEVRSPANRSLNEVVDAATTRGQEIGCDLLVDRAIYKASHADLPRWLTFVAPPSATRAPDVHLLLATLTPAPTAVYASPPPDKREFICGIYLTRDGVPRGR